jgi:hypothetical protein
MGANNRAHRAAKRRKRDTARRRSDNRPGREPGNAGFGAPADEQLDIASLVEDVLVGVRQDVRNVHAQAAWLLSNEAPVSAEALLDEVQRWLEGTIGAVVRGGWTPSDLLEIVRRRLSEDHVPFLAALLEDEADRHRADRVSALWREDLGALGEASAPDLRRPAGLALALGLTGVLGMLPAITEVLPPPGAPQQARRPRTHRDDKQLSRVRALLAKAESTEFDEEAEALSAKAQELISRYALDRLLVEADAGPEDRRVVSRRIWIDAPYVMAKAQLIAAVADANRCRCVVSENLGFATVVGEPRDLDSVELVSTSLLVQASTAMQRHGRQVDQRGASRTRSFRTSFLIAYAARIRERLRAATEQAFEASGHTDRLLPVLRRQEQEVDEALAEMFPDLITRATRITNRLGWAAGRAAADLALLDAGPQVGCRIVVG